MKVAFVVHQYPPRFSTGTEIYAHRLALALRADGHDVRVFTNEPDPSMSYGLVDDVVDGVPVTRQTFFEGLAPNHSLQSYYSVFLGKAFGRWLDQVQPDVVHVFHLMGLGLSCIEECEMRGLPVYVQLMDYWFLCPTVQMLRFDGSLCDGPDMSSCIECLAPQHYGYQLMRMFAKRETFVEVGEPDQRMIDINNAGMPNTRKALLGRKEFIRSVLEKATSLVAPSLFLRRFFAGHGYDEDHMRHVPYGVDPLPEPIAPIPVEKDVITFGFFGSVNPQKGLEILISAFREYKCERFKLIVHGNMQHFPKYAKRVRAFADMDSRINFLGPFDHSGLSAALSSIDVLVVPSVWYENTPFVVLEAFAAGRPVVASDLGGLSELVVDGKNGRTFTAGDPGSLVSVLADFDENPELVTELAQGIGEVRTLEENARDFLALWEGALASRNGVTEVSS